MAVQYADVSPVLLAGGVVGMRVTVGVTTTSVFAGPSLGPGHLVPSVRQVPKNANTYPGDFAQDIKVPTKSISGRVFDANSSPISGATVMLFRQSDSAMVAQATTGADGSYTFVRDAKDPWTYYTVSFTLLNGTPVHGTSNSGLVPI